MMSAVLRGLSLALLLGLTVSCAARQPRAEAQRAPAVGERVYRVPIDGSPVRGSFSAPVTLVMFGDFEDPRSIEVYRAVRKIRAEYGEKVRLVFKHAPRADHERGALAALFALAVRAEKGDASFWRVHDLLFEQNLHLTDGDLIAVAKAAGLAAEPLIEAANRRVYKAKLDADLELLTALGPVEMPALFINGRSISGAWPVETYKAMIDAEIGRAVALMEQRRLPPGEIYEVIQAQAAN